MVLDVTTGSPEKGDSPSPYVARCLDNADICGWDCDCGAVGATIEGEPPQCQGRVMACRQRPPKASSR